MIGHHDATRTDVHGAFGVRDTHDAFETEVFSPLLANEFGVFPALGHGLAVLAIRAHGQAGTKVGPAENLVLCVPAIETPENIQAAEVATRELNAGYLTLMLEGKYTEAFLAHNGEKAPKYTADELGIISSQIDFWGSMFTNLTIMSSTPITKWASPRSPFPVRFRI
jgi:beta-glucosidase/6-phospho-beta-glucosidase/beta-galactosidase